MIISPKEEESLLTVNALIAHVGSRSLRPLVIGDRSDPLISATELLDSTEPLPEAEGTLLFVVSASDLPTLVLREIAEQASELNYAALAMKVAAGKRSELQNLGAEAGIMILEVADFVSWRYLEATIDTLLGEHNLLASSTRHPSYEPLFSIVNELAERFAGSVVIEDLSRNILAYSSLPGQAIDALRTEGILSRRTPYSPLNDEQYRIVLQAEDPVQFPASNDEQARVALAVRAGSVPLGTIWAIEGRGLSNAKLSSDDKAALMFASDAAASHMLDNLRVQDANQKPREATLRRLLLGLDSTGTELVEMGFPTDQPLFLTAFVNPLFRDSASAVAQIRSTILKHHTTYRSDLVSVSVNGIIYTLLSALDEHEAIAIAERTLPLIDRSSGVGCRAAVSGAIAHARDVAQRREDLDAIIQCFVAVESPRVLSQHDVQPQLLINAVAKLLARDSFIKDANLEALTRSNSPSEQELAKTLQTWCSQFGNVARTAAHLGIHENTVRYRLQRISESHSIQLSDADELLSTWLQLRAQLPN